MFAAVDLGSNSFRLHVGQQVGKQMHIVRSARDPIRLAAGLDRNGMLSAAAIEIALRSLRAFAAVLAEYDLDGVRVVATNTLRVAGNAASFLPLAEEALGYPIDIISGEEEGRLIYMGVAHLLADPSEERLVIDIGGGSTEVIRGTGPRIDAVESYGVGTQPQAAQFFPQGQVSRQGFAAAILSARARFEDAATLFPRARWRAAYGSSGTIRAIADVIARNGIGDGTLTLPSLQALQERIVACGSVDRFDLPGVKPERVIVMVGGLSVLAAAMQELGIERVTAVDAGLRLGALCDLEMRANRVDRRDEAVAGCLRRFGADPERAARTAALAAQLHARLKPESERYLRPLAWSALLHEVGHAVSPSGAHKHAAYIVENADLPGFTRGEQRTLGQLVLGQKGNLRKVRETLNDPAFARALFALRLAAMMMHARLDADIAALRLRMKPRSEGARGDLGRIEIDVPRDWKRRHPTAMVWLHKEQECWSEIGVPFSVGIV